MSSRRLESPSRFSRHLPLAGRLTGLEPQQAASKFCSSRVLLTAGEASFATPSGAIMVSAAANLIARFCPKVDVALPAAASELARGVVALMSKIDSTADAEFRVHSSSAGTEYAAALCVGSRTDLACDATFVSSVGWRGYVTPTAASLPRAHDAPDSANPFGALVAAALGAAEVFKTLLQPLPGKAHSFATSSLSAWDYSTDKDDPGPPLPDIVDLPVTLLAGAGAVGNAVVYALLQIRDLGGVLVPVDDQRVDDTNFNRYLLTIESDVGRTDDECTRKTELVSRGLQGKRLRVIPRTERLDETIAAISDRTLPRPEVVVSALDNNEARDAVAKIWADLVLEGATSDSTAQVSRHEHGTGRACLLCIHSSPQLAKSTSSYPERAADATGLSKNRILAAERSADLVVTHDDVQQAPAARRAFLTTQLGKTICSVLTGLSSMSKIAEPPPQVTVSFVSALAGFFAAAELVKYATRTASPLRTLFQVDTLMPLENALCQPVTPSPTCYCQQRAEEIRRYRRLFQHGRAASGGAHG